MSDEHLLTIYYFRTKDGQEQAYKTRNFDNACLRAQTYDLTLIERKYQYVSGRIIKRKEQPKMV